MIDLTQDPTFIYVRRRAAGVRRAIGRLVRTKADHQNDYWFGQTRYLRAELKALTALEDAYVTIRQQQSERATRRAGRAS